MSAVGFIARQHPVFVIHFAPNGDAERSLMVATLAASLITVLEQAKLAFLMTDDVLMADESRSLRRLE
ncbi:hypothetical protein EVAR_8342_1 [Eumeta japonica]|uniref:Uncharacterized protein n=1 Tax=Eumeta variegata TaxID=151549 RepID=A0A4C1VD20_EUMVA|nr:hypothetical protein EVAR_8342_1 [Eumeta japonica]